MKKIKKAIAALMSAATTVTASANIIAYADVDSENKETLVSKLEDYGYPYSRIEDASSIDVQEYSQKDGAVYYVNEKGQIMAVKPIQPDHISIIMYNDTNETKLNKNIADILNDVKVEKGLGCNANGEKIKEIIISPEVGDDISVEQAKDLFEAIKDDVISCEYYSASYMIGHPQYSWREDNTGEKRHHFTSYSDCNDKKDEIQAVIDENNLPCHIEELSGTFLDVVVDVQMSYIDEIAIASMITNATGAKCSWVVPSGTVETLGGYMVELSANNSNYSDEETITDIISKQTELERIAELLSNYITENNIPASVQISTEDDSGRVAVYYDYRKGDIAQVLKNFLIENNIDTSLVICIVAENDIPVQKPLISIKDIINLAKKSDALTWSDFEDYSYADIGNGSYIRKFIIDNTGGSQTLLIGGTSLDEKPEYINYVWGNGAVFDIRTEDLTPWFYDDGPNVTTTVNPVANNITTTTVAEPITEPEKAREAFNKYFEENSIDAVCVTSEEYPSYYPPLVIEYVVGSVTGKQIVEFAEANNIQRTLFKNVPIINGEKVYYVEADVKVKGDANCDYSADMADVVLVMQALANPDKYGENGTAEVHLTAKGKDNADINGDGLTVGDAQAIQEMLLGLS